MKIIKDWITEEQRLYTLGELGPGIIFDWNGRPCLVTNQVKDNMITIVILETGACHRFALSHKVPLTKVVLIHQPNDWNPKDLET